MTKIMYWKMFVRFLKTKGVYQNYIKGVNEFQASGVITIRKYAKLDWLVCAFPFPSQPSIDWWGIDYEWGNIVKHMMKQH